MQLGSGCHTIPASTWGPCRRASHWPRSRKRIVAANASPVGYIHILAQEIGDRTEITREEFFHHGVRAATGYNTTVASSAANVADQLEEMFEATGSRGGFMIPISQAGHRTPVINIIDHLVPELQRRGRFRTAYKGRTLARQSSRRLTRPVAF